jgi:hypothetical protein
MSRQSRRSVPPDSYWAPKAGRLVDGLDLGPLGQLERDQAAVVGRPRRRIPGVRRAAHPRLPRQLATRGQMMGAIPRTFLMEWCRNRSGRRGPGRFGPGCDIPAQSGCLGSLTRPRFDGPPEGGGSAPEGHLFQSTVFLFSWFRGSSHKCLVSNIDGRRAAAAPGRALLGQFPLPRKGHGTPPKRSSDAQNWPSDSPSVVPARGSRVNWTYSR